MSKQTSDLTFVEVNGHVSHGCLGFPQTGKSLKRESNWILFDVKVIRGCKGNHEAYFGQVVQTDRTKAIHWFSFECVQIVAFGVNIFG